MAPNAPQTSIIYPVTASTYNILVPPKYIIIANIGIVANIIKTIMDNPERNFPSIIENGETFVMRSRSRAVSYTHLDVYKRQVYMYLLPFIYFLIINTATAIIMGININK